MKKWVKVFALVVVVLVALGFSLLTTIDKTPIEETTFYKSTQNRLDSLSGMGFKHEGDTLRVGWAKVNLTPPFTTSLAGYGITEFDSVKDSVWVRAFFFDNGQQKVALVVPDLLVFPPTVKKILQTKLGTIGVDAIQYSATHTHHSLGNWHPGLVGRFFAGPFNEAVVDWIAIKSIEAIEKAKSNLFKTKIAYAAIQAEDLVYNRLVDDLGTIDPWLRFMLLEHSGQSAVIASFSAHATTISRDLNAIHRDYPGKLVDELEKINGIDFAAFMAGAVASHGPAGKGIGEVKANFIAQSGASQIQLITNVLSPEYTTKLGYVSVDVDLRDPQVRVSSKLKLRPWVFTQLFGEYSASINAVRIGENILVGTPCDFSGELTAPLNRNARTLGLNLMINSFNGDYIGYITKDTWYELNEYETRDMNWFGPQNGLYFSYIIDRIIKITGSN